MCTMHSLHSDCTMLSIAFYQTLSREGGVWVARLHCVMVGSIECVLAVLCPETVESNKNGFVEVCNHSATNSHWQM